MLPQECSDVLQGSLPSPSIPGWAGGEQRVTKQWAGGWAISSQQGPLCEEALCQVLCGLRETISRLFPHPSQFTGVRSAFLSEGSSCSLLLLLFAVHRCVCVCVCVRRLSYLTL